MPNMGKEPRRKTNKLAHGERSTQTNRADKEQIKPI